MKEVFKDIPNYEGYYQVSNLGNVKSLERTSFNVRYGEYIVTEKILKNSIDSNDYNRVNLYSKGKSKGYQVHQLVAMVFLNHKPNGHKLVIDHINNIKTDNRVVNLQVVSQGFNTWKDRTHTSRYRGVCFDKSRNKWMARVNDKYIGRFNNEYDAYLATKKELICV